MIPGVIGPTRRNIYHRCGAQRRGKEKNCSSIHKWNCACIRSFYPFPTVTHLAVMSTGLTRSKESSFWGGSSLATSFLFFTWHSHWEGETGTTKFQGKILGFVFTLYLCLTWEGWVRRTLVLLNNPVIWCTTCGSNYWWLLTSWQDLSLFPKCWKKWPQILLAFIILLFPEGQLWLLYFML